MHGFHIPPPHSPLHPSLPFAAGPSPPPLHPLRRPPPSVAPNPLDAANVGTRSTPRPSEARGPVIEGDRCDDVAHAGAATEAGMALWRAEENHHVKLL